MKLSDKEWITTEDGRVCAMGPPPELVVVIPLRPRLPKPPQAPRPRCVMDQVADLVAMSPETITALADAMRRLVEAGDER